MSKDKQMVKYPSIDEPYMLDIDCPERTINIYGDLHGCFDELLDLNNLIHNIYGLTNFISLGDIVDRGPDSYGLMDFLHRNFKDKGDHIILGNHEKKLVKKLLGSNVTENDDQRWYNQITDEQRSNILKWCSNLPIIIRIRYPNGHIYNLAHGALPSSVYAIPFQTGRHKLSYKERDVALYGHTTGNKTEHGYPERLHIGCERVNQTNVFGHIVHYNQQLSDFILIDEPGTTIQLDHGCVHGGHLTALCIEPDGSFRFVSQKAREVYMKSKDMVFDLNWNYNY